MKRSFVVHLFITGVLGLNAGFCIALAVSLSNIGFGMLAMLSLSAWILNIFCGPDKESNSNKDEE